MVANKSMVYVIDSSVIICYLLPDEKIPANFKRIFSKFSKQIIDFTAPSVLKYEVGNVLKSAVKRKRISQKEAISLFSTFLDLPIHYSSTNYQATFELSIEHDLTFYDASYLSLAREKNAKLLTLDKKLKNVHLS